MPGIERPGRRRGWNQTTLLAQLGAIPDLAPWSGGCSQGGDADSSPISDVLTSAGFALLAGSTIWSIADAGWAARRTSKERRRALMILPSPLAGPDHSTGYGLSLGGSF